MPKNFLTPKFFQLNQILYGPSGTGKTYLTLAYAVAICEGRALDDVSAEDYADIKTRYKKFFDDGRVKFVTFHQSYGYEDFIEGMEMLRTLRDFAGKNFLNAELDTARLDLYEIFIRVYLEMILELVKRGLKSSYTVREDNLHVFRGKLLVNRHVRENFSHREKFFVAFDEYNLDRAEHRLIKATLFKLLRTTRDRKNFRLTTQLPADFDSVPTSTNYTTDFASVAIDRTNRSYTAVMTWTKIFLAHKTFTAFTGTSEAQALLFPMEKLFEDFVAHHVRKKFSDRFIVRTQVREKFLFDAIDTAVDKLRGRVLLISRAG